MTTNNLNLSKLIIDIQQQLKNNADQHTQVNSQRFFKETITAYGVKTAIVRKISKDLFKQIKDYPKQQIFKLCEKLWQSDYIEESIIACNLSYYLHKDYQPNDFKVFEKWLNNYVNNWATCDTLCNHTIGTFIEMYPDYIQQLNNWTHSANRWVKRGAAVTLIIPARKGLFLDNIFTITDTLLIDKDDMVQKGYGWLLKVASQTHLQAVFAYIMANKSTMPRTALRYAIEKMPTELKAQAMAK
ncbi:DNA alkylation repair protein [Entomomonas asaccharolytica]|uniref:DNA alkylation repair protein n=1 Tax=Entomomonas asaccharolytica TaxID=2785331 RepID=A0A974NFH6_9GAMM|nr:DNA alkylation repair protein [Entomomonas asaccharolytica]QQP85830.1 DNA alkylation repair protein [Entomomonas asaccharolytica]